MDGLIEKREIGNHLIEVYYDMDPECPIQNWDMVGRYLFEYNDRYYHQLSKVCDWKELFSDNRHSLDDALQSLASDLVPQKDLVKYLKDGKVNGVSFKYNRSSRQWELKVSSFYKGQWHWDVEYEIDPAALVNYDCRMELLEYLQNEELIALINDCAKDVVIKEWSSSGYSQGDYIEGIAYVTKENFDKIFGRKDVNWKDYADECIDSKVKDIGMWAWGDVKGFVLKEKVGFTKHYDDKEREDAEDFEYEEIDSCWGYYMETDELINEVISEHNLKETA